MNMISVSSSNLNSVGYENNVLYIKFNNGRVYSYSGVPLSTYHALMSASSHGQYFNNFIKNKYPYAQIN